MQLQPLVSQSHSFVPKRQALVPQQAPPPQKQEPLQRRSHAVQELHLEVPMPL
jgi:hypothetical protein